MNVTFAKQYNLVFMKRTILCALAVLLLVFSGCQSSDKGDPKKVLHNFLMALSQRDFSKAKTYATEDSDGMISMMEMGMQKMGNNIDEGHAGKMMELVNNMKMSPAKIEGDKATVQVTDSKSNESTDFLLKKEKGNWKVAFDMSTLMNMATKKMKEHGMDLNNHEIRGKMDSAMQKLNEMQHGSGSDSH
jgi:hypothetical protein